MTFQISEKEQAFWDWWKAVGEKHQDTLNLRQAFDWGYDYGKESK